MPRKTAAIALIALSVCAAFPGSRGGTDPDDLPTLRVDATLRGEILAEGLPVLGRSAGVRLRCGPNAGNRRICLFVHQHPLAGVVAKLRDFVPEAPGKALLYRDGATWVFDEDSLSRRAREGLARKRLSTAGSYRRGRVREMLNWVQPRAGDTRGEALARTQIGQRWGIFRGMPSALQQAALAGRPVRVSYGDLSPQAQEFLRAIVARRGAAKEGSSNPADRFDGRTDYPRVVVDLWPTGTPDHPGITLELRLCSISGIRTEDLLHPPRWDPEDGWDWKQARKPYSERARGPQGREKNPALQKRITLAGGENWTVERVLDECARASGYPLLGEYDPCFVYPHNRALNGQRTLPEGLVSNRPVWEAMDLVCRQFDLDWTFEKGWIEIRTPRRTLAWAGEIDLSPPDDHKHGAPPPARP